MSQGVEEQGAALDGVAEIEAFVSSSLQSWGFAIDQVLRLAELTPGQRVLDVGCGPGELTLRAAAMVVPDGSAVGVDLNVELVEIARQRAVQQRVRNAAFVPIDIRHLPWRPGEAFDVVLSVFGLMLVDDATAVLARMWDLVRPGGRLVIATPGREFFAPLLHPYLEAVAREGVDVDGLIPWQRLEDPDTISAALLDAGVCDVRISTESRRVKLSRGLQEWDRIVGSTGLSRLQAELDPEAVERVREDVTTWAQVHGVTELDLTAVYATGQKPARVVDDASVPVAGEATA